MFYCLILSWTNQDYILVSRMDGRCAQNFDVLLDITIQFFVSKHSLRKQLAISQKVYLYSRKVQLTSINLQKTKRII